MKEYDNIYIWRIFRNNYKVEIKTLRSNFISYAQLINVYKID